GRLSPPWVAGCGPSSLPMSGLTRRRIQTIIRIIMARQPFTIAYLPKAREDLRAIEPKYHSLIRATIDEQLQFEPDRETRNRKLLRQPNRLGADWELRFGHGNRFRVFYNIDAEGREVEILAIGVKERSRLFIGGEEMEI